jgi:quercetin dioxygenase-like cupin family protein
MVFPRRSPDARIDRADTRREGGPMTIIRGQDRPVHHRGPELPTLQRLVDRANGSETVSVLINRFTNGEAVPEHTHEVEEVLVVTTGECVVTIDGQQYAAREGDAVIVKPGATHSIAHSSEYRCTVVAVLASADAKIWSE